MRTYIYLLSLLAFFAFSENTDIEEILSENENNFSLSEKSQSQVNDLSTEKEKDEVSSTGNGSGEEQVDGGIGEGKEDGEKMKGERRMAPTIDGTTATKEDDFKESLASAEEEVDPRAAMMAAIRARQQE